MESEMPTEKQFVIVPPVISENKFAFDDSWYVIHHDCDNITNKQMNELSPLLVDDEISKAKPGIYVWIMTHDANGKNSHLYAKQTLMPQEIQTKHLNILIELKNHKVFETSTVLCAGEFKIDENNNKLSFNYESGTIMQNSQMSRENTNYVVEIFSKYFEKEKSKNKSKNKSKERRTVEYDSSFIIAGMQLTLQMINTIAEVCPGKLYKFETKSKAIRFTQTLENNKILLQKQQKIRDAGKVMTEQDLKLLDENPVDIKNYNGNIVTEPITETNSDSYSGGSKKTRKTKRNKTKRNKTKRRRKR
jgi:hypothetical protein